MILNHHKVNLVNLVKLSPVFLQGFFFVQISWRQIRAHRIMTVIKEYVRYVSDTNLTSWLHNNACYKITRMSYKITTGLDSM
jgi:hypothetical protein